MGPLVKQMCDAISVLPVIFPQPHSISLVATYRTWGNLEHESLEKLAEEFRGKKQPPQPPPVFFLGLFFLKKNGNSKKKTKNLFCDIFFCLKCVKCFLRQGFTRSV